nr:g-type lectin s-receptor-like serine/threonine-protein kinase [Quercus suber]
MWSGIWCLWVPPKVKHMLWRATHEAIPTLLNMWKRKVVSSVTCPRCLMACKDTIHSLWSCPVLRVIWEATVVGQKLLKHRFMTFADLMETVMEMKDCFDINLVAVILWMIWECRNSNRVGGYSTDLRTIRVKALTFLHDFSSAQIPRQVQLLVSSCNTSLTIDDYGNLKISYNGSLSIVLYSGQEASNASAVLLDTGNFVLRETSSERQLWQSFDYPTHALVSGMRLGVDRKTGHTWSLTSWRGELVPAVGPFTLGLEPNLKNRLVILWRESPYWTSPNVHFSSTPIGLTGYGYQFSYILNENETYLNYTGEEENYTAQVIRPLLKTDYLGRLSDEFVTLVDCTNIFNHQGCKAQCRSHDDTFTPVSSSMKDGFKFDESDNLIHKDCEAKCFHNCSCVAYASTDQVAQTGCEIWSTTNRFIGFSNPNARTIYFLTSALGERKKKQKMLIKELGGNVKASTVNGEENQQNNDEKIFSFESICAATSNFSIENKLGEGGFGPVSKRRRSNNNCAKQRGKRFRYLLLLGLKLRPYPLSLISAKSITTLNLLLSLMLHKSQRTTLGHLSFDRFVVRDLSDLEAHNPNSPANDSLWDTNFLDDTDEGIDPSNAAANTTMQQASN